MKFTISQNGFTPTLIEQRLRLFCAKRTARLVWGFTLVETLVAFFLLSLILGVATNLFVSGIASQRHAVASQTVVDEISFVAEYMGRALRQAKKDLEPFNRCLTAYGSNYEVVGGTTVRFLDENNKCREFLFDAVDKQIEEKVSPDETFAGLGAPAPVTSNNLEVMAVKFSALGEIQGGEPVYEKQPRITFFIEARGKGQSGKMIQLQTTISQRDLDVLR